MGYEVCYIYHPKKEEGVGYDTEVKEELKRDVGKPFDDTPLQKLADAVVAQFARRDIMVVDVKVHELVRKEISFKESKDGKAIVLKGRRFPLDGTHAPEPVEMIEPVSGNGQLVVANGDLQPHELVARQNYQNQMVAKNIQPHEVAQQATHMEKLYNDPNAPVPIQNRIVNMPPVNQNKTLYEVWFDPEIVYVNEIKSRGLHKKFTVDRKYPVHQIVPHPLGKLELQKLIVSDDRGKVTEVEEKFFTNAGKGLLGDAQLGFSGSNKRGSEQRARLMYEDQMVMDAPAVDAIPEELRHIPVDDGSVTAESLQMPDIRSGQKR